MRDKALFNKMNEKLFLCHQTAGPNRSWGFEIQGHAFKPVTKKLIIQIL